jgi:hypothetical protein
MAKAAHIAFARNAAGRIAAATDFFVTQQAVYFCIACGQLLRRESGNAGFPHFVHEASAACKRAAHAALRAAACQVLEECRFIKAPSPVDTSKYARDVLIQWAESATDIEVDGTRVDFLAEGPDGQLSVVLTISGQRAALRAAAATSLPTLEVTLPPPGEVGGFADLRQALLHASANKRWLWYPAPKDRVRARDDEPGVATAVPAPAAQADGPWRAATTFLDSARYQQLDVSEKRVVLEERMKAPCDRWPAQTDVEVPGEESFGVDRRIWQADVFARFVRQALPRSNVSTFSAEEVVNWLSARYVVTAPFPGANVFAAKTYLSALVTHGYLRFRDPARRQLEVTRTALDGEARFVWSAHAKLSASELRVRAQQANLRIPVERVQWLLESFDDCHPAGTVAEFVSALSRQLHATPRAITAFLLDARLIEESAEVAPTGVQASLF